jgi:exosortase/archaeosortase family protein
MAEGGGPLLGINNFRAIVGKSCSGIDSFLLFTSLYTLIFILDYKRLKKKLAILLYFLGIVGMFFVNILRIFLLFIIGAYIDAKFAVGLFHTNAGWVLFLGYFFIYWIIVSKYIYIKGVNK